jgi:hypothetical protein
MCGRAIGVDITFGKFAEFAIGLPQRAAADLAAAAESAHR